MIIQNPTRQHEQGFTLVELAIVLVIVGLLITGVLKGQELIGSAQVTATTGQLKSVEAAANTFRDSYGALPGDLVGPAARLPNCNAAPCNVTGNGNSIVGADAALGAALVVADENFVFWNHLSKSNLLTRIRDVNTINFGTSLPTTDLGGGLRLGYTTTTLPALSDATIPPFAGHYVGITNTPAAALAAGTVALTPFQASRLDLKLDDGLPNSGTVRGAGTATGATGCVAAAGGQTPYNDAVPAIACMSYIRMQF